jgi:class 3 adenylate cyclase
MNVVILEDELFSAKRLSKMIKELRPAYMVQATIDSIENAIHWLNSNPQPDLILMDVRVADGMSFELFKHIQISSPVIFITAYDEYALEAFKSNGIDYLLKPVDKQTLEESLSKLELLGGRGTLPPQFDEKQFMNDAYIVEEERAFMFIDLNNSTMLAEKLGHMKYSKFLTSYYELLLWYAGKYKAETYQVVGDEIVLTWPIKNLSDSRNPFQLHYTLERALLSREEFFWSKYQTMPRFTSSVHKGKVAMSYIGGQLKDRAYHGDVLNTAARMLEQAKLKKVKLVTSADFLSGVINSNPFIVHALGPLKVRGKSNPLELFSIEAPSMLAQVRGEPASI